MENVKIQGHPGSHDPVVKRKMLNVPKAKQPQHGKPRRLPIDLRDRLSSLLGGPITRNTTNSNLTEIAERLGNDLEKYKQVADYWQQQYRMAVGLEEPLSQDETNFREATSDETVQVEDAYGDAETQQQLEMGLILRSQKISDAHTTSLTLAPLNLRIFSRPPEWFESLSGLSSQELFLQTLQSASRQASIVGMYQPLDLEWPEISKMKPNWNMDTARFAWNLLFQPINTLPSSFNLDASSSSRYRACSNDDDDVGDEMDQWLSTCSDYEVVDTLLTCAVFLVGFLSCPKESISRHPELLNHAGMGCERILKHILLIRNFSNAPNLIQGVVSSCLGLFRWYVLQGRITAMDLVSEICWLLADAPSNRLAPAWKAFAAFQACLTANSAKRYTWIRRAQACLDSNSLQFFPLNVSYHFTLCNVALKAKNDDEVLVHLRALDLLLADSNPVSCPTPEYSPSSESSEEDTIGDFEHIVNSFNPPSDNTTFPDPCLTSPVVSNYAAKTFYPLPYTFYDAHNPHEIDLCSLCSYQPFIPSESYKTLLRAFVCVIRAEYASNHHKPQTCLLWIERAVELMKNANINMKTKFLMQLYDVTVELPYGKSNLGYEITSRCNITKQ